MLSSFIPTNAQAAYNQGKKILEVGDRLGSNWLGRVPFSSDYTQNDIDAQDLENQTVAYPPVPPSRDEYRAAVDQSYAKGTPPLTQVGSFAFFESTPTLKFYKSTTYPIRYLVSVRGTKYGEDYGNSDLQADKLIAFGQLEQSPRYMQDAADMQRVLGNRPEGEKVYVTGHSLGGAICDLFLFNHLADAAVTYNPAMQLNKQEPKNHRVYNDHDPLYLLGVPHFNTPPEVHKDTNEPPYNYVRRLNPGLLVYDELRAHDLANLSGTGRGAKRTADMMGKGFFDSPMNTVSGVIKSTTGIDTNALPKLDTNLANISGNIAERFGYNNYDKKTRDFLQAHGDERVTSLKIRRAPVAYAVHALLNAVTAGTWAQTRPKYGYDDIFHVALIVNDKYAIQRIGRVSVNFPDNSPDAEYFNIYLGRGNANHSVTDLTMNKILSQTEQRVGHNTFWMYDSFKNNCQHFILNILTTLGYNAQPGVTEFLLQPTEELLKEQPDSTQTIANFLTNLGAITGVGTGKPKRHPEGDESVPGLHKAFSEDDIRRIAGDIPILRYPELASMMDTSQLFKGKVGAALLFLTEGGSDGHWIAVLDKPDHHEVFDSFGTAVDGDRAWLDKHKLMEFHETAPLLSILLRTSGKKVMHNTHKLQEDTADTCGRYVAGRIARADTPLHQFVADLTSNGRSPDVNITEMTNKMKGGFLPVLGVALAAGLGAKAYGNVQKANNAAANTQSVIDTANKVNDYFKPQQVQTATNSNDTTALRDMAHNNPKLKAMLAAKGFS